MTAPAFKKKLSAKTIVGDVRKMVRTGELKGGETLYRAIGIAEGTRTGESNYGQWTSFSGTFEVINVLTGEVYQGAEFFPDKGFTDALLSRMQANPGQSVEFALEVGIDVSDDYPTGFAYVARPIVERAHDRLGALRDRFKALEAPKDQDADEEAPAAPAKGKVKAKAGESA